MGVPVQLVFPAFNLSEDVEKFAQFKPVERGAIFTRSEVVNFILDLAGYTVDAPLHKFRLLEPSFGEGDFLLPVVERLLTAYETHTIDRTQVVSDLSNSIRAFEIHPQSIEHARVKLHKVIKKHGISRRCSNRLIDAWLKNDDFLLAELPHAFTHTIGNPPYVRQEMVPESLMSEYRARYRTIYDRADLYVPFIERCLTSLQPSGTLAFICSDRWMKNKYGGPLRLMIANHYHLACYIDMVDTPAFHTDVTAYPAITIIKREKHSSTRVAHRPAVNKKVFSVIARDVNAKTLPEGSHVVEVKGVTNANQPWILHSFDQLAIVRRLEEDFPSIEDVGCKVGIGVATGSDRVFIGRFESLDVEPDRKLPLVRTKDIQNGTVSWQGYGVINPFSRDGSLVKLPDYPRLARFLNSHSDAVRKRNCAKNNPKNWYRTIDRIYPELAYKPKLLIPDIKGEAHIVLEEGRLYPHHNLYYITSEDWDLKALLTVLRSGIAKLFVSAYSTKMRGGYLRFQAQYLRRIRLPRWQDVPNKIRQTLSASAGGDIEIANNAVFKLYRMNSDERLAIGGNGSE